eukprot:3527103-Prymnesium_polylepis.2
MAFQDRTMHLLCQHLLPEAKRDIYLQGDAHFDLPQKRVAIKVFCSPNNPGAAELAKELNQVFAVARRTRVERDSFKMRRDVRRCAAKANRENVLDQVVSRISRVSNCAGVVDQ